MSEINGEKVSLKKLLSDDFFFCIPDYQRPYSWQKSHCEQLFEDIDESNRQNEYFLGTIILQEIGKIGTGKKYDVIDGQQRITTLQILLACLRDAVNDKSYKEATQKKIYQKENLADGIPEQARLEVKEKECFKQFIQEENGTTIIDGFEPANDIQQNIRQAIVIFQDQLREKNQDEIKALIEHVSQRCIFIYVSTKDFDDAYRLFTIINDRGLQLRRIDILKANNLQPSIIKKESQRAKYASLWEAMENDLGSEDFENLLYFIRTIEIKEKAKEDLLKEYNKLIFGKQILNKGIGFIKHVEMYKKIFQKVVLDGDVLDADNRLRMNSIQYKNLVSIMSSQLANEWIPPLLFYYSKFGKDYLLELLLKLEAKYVADWVIGLTPTKRILNMTSILKQIEKSNDVAALFSSDVFKYDKKRLKDELNQDLYNKPYAKYILLKLEYLTTEHNVLRRYGSVSVEHVLPQNPKEGSNWDMDFTPKEKIKWTNKLANLVLLSKRKNSSASNRDFIEKKEKYLKGRITDLARSQEVLSYATWTPAILKSRQDDAIGKLIV
ncbi:MAG: DUF262 domain-containing protein [Peptococcaceae bacterium]|nr:DUF262 domain-containing protein [Peptococcaceae bacterium]